MKRFIYLALLLCSAIANAGELQLEFSGLLRPDTIVVNRQSDDENARGVTSVNWLRVPVTSDAIVIKLNDDERVKVEVWHGDAYNNRIDEIIGPGETARAIIVDGNFKDAKVIGTPFCDSKGAYIDAYKSFTQSEDYKSLEREDAIMATYKFNYDYALSHRNEDIAVYALCRMPLAMAAQIVDSIGSDARTGFLETHYAVVKERAEDFRLAQNKKKRNEQGGLAPDFELVDSEGKTFRLSELRGKYVLLDFWATWCKWCIKGFPELAGFAEEYGDKCVVVALSTDSHSETWIEYLDSHSWPWINLWVDPTLHGEMNPMESYAVDALPTKFLIGPKGEIVKYQVGENPEFLEDVKRILDEI